MPGLRDPRELFEKAKFTVEDGGLTSASFAKCSTLEVEVDKIEYREGGSLIPYKIPGLIKFSDVTLERGSASNADLYAWMLDVGNAAGGAGGTGLVPPGFKRNLSINQRRRDNTTAMRHDLFLAFPIKFVAGEWDNSASEVVIEMLTLTFDFFERVVVS